VHGPAEDAAISEQALPDFGLSDAKQRLAKICELQDRARGLALELQEPKRAKRLPAHRERVREQRARELAELLELQVREIGRLLDDLLEAGRPSSGAELPASGSGAPRSEAKRVLIVDGNRDGAESLALLLRLCGHEVHTLGEGAAALAAVSALEPDFIVMDIGPPDLDGCTLARALRARGCTARLAAITGYGQPEDLKRAREAGFDHYFVKPIDPLELERLLAEGPGSGTDGPFRSAGACSARERPVSSPLDAARLPSRASHRTHLV
jgi:CheY-like chemotaxis protein